jgi:hypothetical protein
MFPFPRVKAGLRGCHGSFTSTSKSLAFSDMSHFGWHTRGNGNAWFSTRGNGNAFGGNPRGNGNGYALPADSETLSC